MSHQLLTGLVDTDKYVIKYLDIDGLINYALVSKSTHNVSKDLYKIISKFSKTFIKRSEFVDYLSTRGKVVALEWFRGSSPGEFVYTKSAINRAAQWGHTNVLSRKCGGAPFRGCGSKNLVWSSCIPSAQ